MKKIYTSLGKPKKPAPRKPRKTVAEWKAEIAHLNEALNTQANYNNGTAKELMKYHEENKALKAEKERMLASAVKLPFGWVLIKPKKLQGEAAILAKVAASWLHEPSKQSYVVKIKKPQSFVCDKD